MDMRGDNLAVYPDGHKYCYSCGYSEQASIKQRLSDVQQAPRALDFPSDYSRYLPHFVLQWLAKYQLTQKEIVDNRFGWSASRELLIMPVYDTDNQVIMWQGRNFKTVKSYVDVSTPEFPHLFSPRTIPDGPKYITKGQPSDILHIIEPLMITSTLVSTIIVVEDLISAIKVGRVCSCLPLWGSNMGLGTLKRLQDRFKRLGMWLDPDKTVASVKTALRASQFMESFVITTASDPKDYSAEAISVTIEQAMRNVVPTGIE
jgi:hypothetical protein